MLRGISALFCNHGDSCRDKKNNQKNSPLNNHITCNERAVEPLEQQKIQQFTFLHVPLFPNYFEYLKKGPQKNHADMFTVLFTGRLLGFTKKKKVLEITSVLVWRWSLMNNTSLFMLQAQSEERKKEARRSLKSICLSDV